MSKKHHIESIVKRYIKSIHKLGEIAGGSGHIGHASLTLDKCDFKQLENSDIEVHFKYTIITETEFTYSPDDFPAENIRESYRY